MRNSTKITALILSMAIMSFSSITSFANETENKANIISEVNESTKPQAFYNSFTGTVKKITDGQQGMKTVFVQNKDGREANFIVSENTYLVDDTKITLDSEITGFYESGKMMIMIYPPQYSIDIIAGNLKDTNIKADKFDSDLLSADKTLKLNIGEQTEIVWENGTTVNWFAKPTLDQIAGVLSNRKLIVLYNFSTKSLPAQTTPTKIIVLSEQESIDNPAEDVSGYDIVVNNTKIDAPSPYTNGDVIVMVPLRAIAEALGYTVSWFDEIQSVLVGKDIILTIGLDSYPVKLKAAPILKDERTYVPLNFFKEVVLLSNVTASDGKIVIDANALKPTN